jgi:hypothetical protein
VDTQVVEIGSGTKRWEKQTLVRSTINSGYTYITQFENNPGNFVRRIHFCHFVNFLEILTKIKVFLAHQSEKLKNLCQIYPKKNSHK